MEQITDALAGPEVNVYWSLQGQGFAWRGFVTRFERVDEATRTARLVVEVRNVDMVATVNVGDGESRPALAIGMHCRAELPAKRLAGALMVPRHAVHDNRWVYVFEPDPQAGDDKAGRLGRRKVPMLRSVGDSVLVEYAGREGTEVCELAPGERVVVSPLIKPVVGMKVRMRDEQIVAAGHRRTDLPRSGPVVGPPPVLAEASSGLDSGSSVMGQANLICGGG
jgi:hypothetical protein